MRVDNPAESGYDRFVGLEHLEPGEASIRNWGSTTEVISSMKLFKAGDILVGRRNVYLRRAAKADFDGVCSGDAIVLRPHDGACLPELLPFILSTNSFWQYALSQADGTMSKRITVKRLMTYEFALPPMEEQRRIVQVLTSVERCLEAFDYVMRVTYDVSAAMLENVLPRGSEGSLIPVERLLREPPRNGVSPRTDFDGQGFRTVSISAVRNGVFEPAGCLKHADIDVTKAEPFFVKSGDVFVIRGNGNRQIAGKAGLSDRSYDDLFYPDLLIRLRFDNNKILPRFAVAQWNLPSVHRRLSARAKSSNGIWKVNGQDIRAHRLFVPTLREQERILRELDALHDAIRVASKREQALQRIKSMILATLVGDEHE